MGNAFFLVIAGLLLFYVVISDKFYCIEGCIACLGGQYVPEERGNIVEGAGTWGASGAAEGSGQARAGGWIAPPSIGSILGYGINSGGMIRQ